MKVALLHNAVAEADAAADRDVLVQAAAVEEALARLGHSTRRIACTLNFELAEAAIVSDRPDVVFNLVESLGGTDRLAHLAAVLLEDLDLPYTGTRAKPLHLTNNKPRAKERLRAAGLPTPDWIVPGGEACVLAPPYIIKAVWEHASVGLDEHALIDRGDGSTVCEQIESRTRQLGYPCFAEQFIAGREFNLSLIAGGEAPRVLPPAEIDFSAFPEGKPRIVGYAAKWDEQAAEFHSTPRTFDFPAGEAPLLDTLRAMAVDCWRLFDLRGYARIDFRVDARGRPWILEINANPCLSQGAGFAAALARADIPLERAVAWIIDDALRPAATTADADVTAVGHVRPMKSSSGAEPLTIAPAIAEREPDKPPARAKRPPAIKLRSDVRPDDAEAVRRIVASTGLFRPAEIDVAVELVQARLDRGEASGYQFLIAEHRARPVAYACYGRNTLTVGSFDLYWIAVDRSRQGQGIGRLLLDEVERRVQAAGGTRIYIETSHRADYQPTRGFYERCGYRLEAVLADYYAPGDDRAIYVKVLAE